MYTVDHTRSFGYRIRLPTVPKSEAEISNFAFITDSQDHIQTSEAKILNLRSSLTRKITYRRQAVIQGQGMCHQKQVTQKGINRSSDCV